MLPHLRTALFVFALSSGVWAGAASAQWPWSSASTNVRLDPHYGGACEGCDLSGRILAGAKMSNSVFNRSDFTGAVMARVNASRSQFRDANLTRVDLDQAVLVNAMCEGADFREARMPRVRADGATFTGANLERANIEDGSFIRANLVGARLRNARMRGADLSGADLRRVVGLTQRQLSQACGDERTRLPRGMRINQCSSGNS